MSPIRRYFISGLLIWLPIWITILAFKFLVDILGSIFVLLPKSVQPDHLIGFHIPGFGVIMTLLVIFLTGLVVTNFLGKKLVIYWDAMIGRIPLVRSIYMSVKQVLETLFMPGGQSFRKVLLVEYPRQGMWSLAFQTGDFMHEVDKTLDHGGMVTLFIPTTPNPTSGFILMVPRKDVIEMEMSVEQALKFVISLGVVQPIINNNGHKKTILG
ncbi:MAG: DUF502 domain-containing protein [Gammaproteobacteria bacterium]|nr:DUF502 domain-containing protein [Gammaproteobacteria bacterium]